MKKHRVHLFTSADVVRSVLKGHKITASCGTVKTVTREEVSDANDAKVCAECINNANADYDEWTVISPRGWTALLERVWLTEHQTTGSSISFRFTGTWNSSSAPRTDPPLAA